MRPPDLVNDTGTIRAWRWVPIPGVGPPDWQAGIASWFVECDGPLLDEYDLFHAWYVGCVRLDDRPGVEPPKRHFPDAQFELSCWTLDPTKNVTAELFEERAMTGKPGLGPKGIFVTPPDIVFQWKGTSDIGANEVLSAFIRAVVIGGISPSRPAVSAAYTIGKLAFDTSWERRLESTIEHFATGHWTDPQEHRA